MQLIKEENAYKGQNSDNCTYAEYDFQDKDIDISTAVIKGRYPDNGYCVNEKCKEMIFILEGEGTLCKTDEIISFKKGDAILINKNEPYYWQANCKVSMTCTPAWTEEQHKLIKE